MKKKITESDKYEMESAVRFKDELTGELKIVKRGEPMYSTALFMAEEIFLKGKWKPYG